MFFIIFLLFLILFVYNIFHIKIHIPRRSDKLGFQTRKKSDCQKNKHESKQTSTDGAKADFNNYKYDFEADEKLREVLQKIINFANINIEIVGCWIWVDGATYEYKDELKALGFK